MTTRHTLLQAQLRQCSGGGRSLDLERFCDLVDDAYRENDRDRRRTDRSIGLMVEELETLNGDLEKLVAERTTELKVARISLDATLQNTAEGIFVIDGEARVLAFNARARELLDMSADAIGERPHVGALARRLAASGAFDFPVDPAESWLCADRLGDAPAAYEARRVNGQILEIRTVPLGAGGAVRVIADVTQARQRQADLEQAERVYRNLFENAAAGFYRATLDGRIVDANRALARIFDYSDVAHFVQGFNAGDQWRHVTPDCRRVFSRHLRRDGHVTDFVCQLEEIATGRRMWLAQTAWLVRDGEGAPLYYEGSVSDITARRSAEERMAHLALHDSLTGLPNRAALMRCLEAFEREGEQGFAIHCVDLDRFKEVNDDLGHGAGDELLRQAARRLQRHARKGDVVARLGGDEFAFVQRRATTPRAVNQLAARLIAALSEDFEIEGFVACVGASVGSAMRCEKARSGAQLLKNADIALYRAKSEGGGRSRFYDEALDAEHTRRRLIESSLRPALVGGQFHLVYQPILNLREGVVESYEALLRWTHPTAGAISPGEFVPIAEQSAAIEAIGEWVLREACSVFAAAARHVGVNVNVSATQLRKRDFAAMVARVLAETGLEPPRLTLEITETALLADNAVTAAQLDQLRRLGVRLSLDDFGAGHASLTYLRRCIFDQIKIDRAFIAGGDRCDIAVINAVIALGRDLDIQTVTEGVETQEQLDDLAAMGCASAQGYHLGRPAPAQSWPDLLAQPSAVATLLEVA